MTQSKLAEYWWSWDWVEAALAYKEIIKSQWKLATNCLGSVCDQTRGQGEIWPIDGGWGEDTPSVPIIVTPSLCEEDGDQRSYDQCPHNLNIIGSHVTAHGSTWTLELRILMHTCYVLRKWLIVFQLIEKTQDTRHFWLCKLERSHVRI